METVPNRFNKGAKTETARLTLFVVCEDRAAEIRAKIFFDHLAINLCSQVCLDINLWRLNLLRTALLRERAAVEAARARAIIVSLDHRTGIPEDMEEWISRWLGHKEDRAYVMGVLHEDDLTEIDPKNPQLDYVRGLAAQAGTDFFSWDAQNEYDFSGTVAKMARLTGLHVCTDQELHAACGQ